jgi:hypothetical protein
MNIKDKWKIFVVNHMTFAFNCKEEFDRVALFDRLVDGNEVGLGVEGLEISELFLDWDFDDFRYYMKALARELQDADTCKVGIKDKWKRYVVDQFVSSYSHTITKIELFDNLVEKGGGFVVELYQVKFFSLYDGYDVGRLVSLMMYNAMLIQQIDNSEEGN